MSSGRTGAWVSGRLVASRTAATIAGVDDNVGGSPAPRSPYGECGSGRSNTSMRIGGVSRMVGMR